MTIRTIIAAALVAAAFAGPAAAAPDKAAGTARTEAAAERIDASEARRIARDYLKANDIRNARVTGVREVEDGFRVELRSVEGIPLSPLMLDAQGKVKGQG